MGRGLFYKKSVKAKRNSYNCTIYHLLKEKKIYLLYFFFQIQEVLSTKLNQVLLQSPLKYFNFVINIKMCKFCFIQDLLQRVSTIKIIVNYKIAD